MVAIMQSKMTTELFELPLVLIMTFALLFSSYICGIAIYYMRQETKVNDVLDDHYVTF